jgi:xylulokinase
MDARGRAEVAEAVRTLGAERLHRVTGKPPCITPSFYKARHLFRGRPELRSGDVRFLDVHAFLVWRLSGELVTSTASADPLGLVDLRTGDWASDLVSDLGLAMSALPRLAKPGDTIGSLRADIAQRVGLRAGVPIVAGAGDGQAAGLGAGITSADRAYLNLGTALGRLGQREKGTRSFEEAVVAFRAALEERTRGKVPLSWAMTQNNLGNALRSLGERVNKTEPLEEAVTAYRAALQEFTRDKTPFDWAMTNNNLGGVLKLLGERSKDPRRIEQAIQSYELALSVRELKTAKQFHDSIQTNLWAASALLSTWEKP